MTMMGLEPELPLDPKRLDGPDFRKKRKVYAGPYSSGTGPRKPRMSKEPTSTVVANPTPWNDSTPQQPPPIVLQTPPQPQQSLPTLPPPPSASADLPVIATQQPAGPRMFNPRMTMLTSQQQTQLMQQAQLDQQRMFRYQPQQTMQTQAVQQTQLNQHVQQSLQVQTQQPQLSQQRVYQGTPPTMLGSEQMYTTNGAYAKQSIEASPSQKPEESQGQSVQIQHMPQQQQQQQQGGPFQPLGSGLNFNNIVHHA
uniref:Uncharacterized protein n=1 Tax=Cacopsylla melanoneura TaxID=428564 RepID=A0A8D8VVJ9_9HEMI